MILNKEGEGALVRIQPEISVYTKQAGEVAAGLPYKVPVAFAERL